MDKTCDTCKYGEYSANESPCFDCTSFNGWEPEENGKREYKLKKLYMLCAMQEDCIDCPVKNNSEMRNLCDYMDYESTSDEQLDLMLKCFKESTRNIWGKVSRHKQLCEELNTLYERKNRDYGDSFGESFKEYGVTMTAIRLSDKLNRFKTLIKGDSQQVNDESIKDTLLDLANYAIMTVMEMEGNNDQD